MVSEYDGWHAVPAHLFTRTQLADLDLPRAPGGPVRAYVTAPGAISRREAFELYDIAESDPSPATARQLEAAAARRKPGTYRCADCGAHTERPAIRIRDVADRRRLVCLACRHITDLRETLSHLAVLRAQAAARAATWLAEDTAAVLHVTVHTPPPAPSGRKRPAVAVSVDAVTPAGNPLVSLGIRLRRSRHDLVPTGALDWDDAVTALRGMLQDRPLIAWRQGDLAPIAAVLVPEGATAIEVGNYWCLRQVSYLHQLIAQWRGEAHPRTGVLRAARHPGRADLLALLIRRMAADHTPTAVDVNTSAPAAVTPAA